MSSLVLIKPFACLVVMCWSLWISLYFYCLLCAGEDLLPHSDDADEDCQWEVQTDESWIPY
jgi:hypothetical protein